MMNTMRKNAQEKRAQRIKDMDAELEERMKGRYTTRRSRRTLAGAGAALLGLLWVDAAVSWALAPSDTAMIANFVVLGVLVVVGLPVAGQLMATTRGIIGKREHELDERQATARLQAFRTAHTCTTAVIVAVIAVVSIADDDGRDSQIPGAALFLILFALLVTHMLLPLVVAAWQSPDPLPDDEDEDDLHLAR